MYAFLVFLLVAFLLRLCLLTSLCFRGCCVVCLLLLLCVFLQYRVGGVVLFMLFSWLACWCLFDVGGANVRCGC